MSRSEVLLAVVLLIVLVGLQSGFRYWTVHRTKVAWEGAQEALSGGDYETAVKRLSRCVDLMPLWLQPRFVLGAVLARLGKLSEAEEQLKMAAALQPREPDGHIELGIFYVTAAGREADGIAAFREAVTHDAGAWKRLESDPRLAVFRETGAYTELSGELGEREPGE